MPTPYDGRFKLLAEEFPGLLLRLLGIVEPGCSLETIDILRELQLDPVQVDHVYKIGGDRLVHFEAITSWRTDRVPKLALYRFLMRQKYALPLDSYIVLMAKRYAPRTLPKRIVYEEHDGFRIEAPYQVIRLWEIDPAIAFEPGCEALLPWVPALNSTPSEVARATAAIQHLTQHPEQAPYSVDTMIGNLAALASLRYGKLEARKLIEKLQRKIMLSTDLFTDSWLYKDGKAEGEAIGEAKGKLEGKLEDLRTAFQLRFPEASLPPEIETLSNLDTVQQAFRAVLQAANAAEATEAVRQAAQ